MGAFTVGGIFTADGNGNITGGTEDFNNNGSFNAGSSSPSQIAGVTYSMASNGRGTAKIQTSKLTLNLAIYPASNGTIQMIELDTNALSSGAALTQATGTTFSNSTFLRRVCDQLRRCNSQRRTGRHRPDEVERKRNGLRVARSKQYWCAARRRASQRHQRHSGIKRTRHRHRSNRLGGHRELCVLFRQRHQRCFHQLRQSSYSSGSDPKAVLVTRRSLSAGCRTPNRRERPGRIARPQPGDSASRSVRRAFYPLVGALLAAPAFCSKQMSLLHAMPLKKSPLHLSTGLSNLYRQPVDTVGRAR